MAFRQILIAVIGGSFEALGQVFWLLYISCRRIARWIHAQKREVETRMMELEAGQKLIERNQSPATRVRQPPSVPVESDLLPLGSPSEAQVNLEKLSGGLQEQEVPVIYRRRFYAVAVGRNPGIYMTWADANREVCGYPGKCHQGFRTRAEAEYFLARYGASVE